MRVDCEAAARVGRDIGGEVSTPRRPPRGSVARAPGMGGVGFGGIRLGGATEDCVFGVGVSPCIIRKGSMATASAERNPRFIRNDGHRDVREETLLFAIARKHPESFSATVSSERERSCVGNDDARASGFGARKRHFDVRREDLVRCDVLTTQQPLDPSEPTVGRDHLRAAGVRCALASSRAWTNRGARRRP